MIINVIILILFLALCKELFSTLLGWVRPYFAKVFNCLSFSTVSVMNHD